MKVIVKIKEIISALKERELTPYAALTVLMIILFSQRLSKKDIERAKKHIINNPDSTRAW